MIVIASNTKEWNALAQFLNYYAGVHPSADMKLMGWVRDDNLMMVVGFNGFMGKLCSVHIAMLPEFHYTPKVMLREVFNYAFNTAERELLIGLVNSNDEKTLEYDRHLGFKELWRIPEMHDNGGDLVVFGMYKRECAYIQPEKGVPKSSFEQPATLNS